MTAHDPKCAQGNLLSQGIKNCTAQSQLAMSPIILCDNQNAQIASIPDNKNRPASVGSLTTYTQGPTWPLACAFLGAGCSVGGSLYGRMPMPQPPNQWMLLYDLLVTKFHYELPLDRGSAYDPVRAIAS